MIRRWRKKRPHCGGWWLWKEGNNEPIKILLATGGTEVATDDEWEAATGRAANHDGWSENYWEMTSTTQAMMPGLWMQA